MATRRDKIRPPDARLIFHDGAHRHAVDRHPNIHRVELRPVDKPLTTAEMMEAGREAEEDINAVAEQLAATVEDENESPPTLH